MDQIMDIIKIVIPLSLPALSFLYSTTNFYRKNKANEDLVKRISFSIANSSNLCNVLTADKFKKIYITLSKSYCINIKWLDYPTTVVIKAISYLIDRADFCKDKHVYEQIQKVEMIMSTNPFENFTYHKMPRSYKTMIAEYIEDCRVPAGFLFFVLYSWCVFTNFSNLNPTMILTYAVSLFIAAYFCIFIVDGIWYTFFKIMSTVTTLTIKFKNSKHD